MEMEKRIEKRAYSKPKILRVKLSPEQAVLGACSVGVTSISNGGTGGCRGGRGACRQNAGARGTDSAPSS